MKKITTLTFLLFLISFGLKAQNNQPKGVNDDSKKSTDGTIIVDSPTIDKVATGISKIVFKESVHDFGNITQNIPATIVFEYTNAGNEPIAITDAVASCGCTKPIFSAEKLEPGKTGKLTVTYNAANLGFFTKNVTVTLSNGETVMISIKGNVETASAPAPVQSN